MTLYGYLRAILPVPRRWNLTVDLYLLKCAVALTSPPAIRCFARVFGPILLGRLLQDPYVRSLALHLRLWHAPIGVLFITAARSSADVRFHAIARSLMEVPPAIGRNVMYQCVCAHRCINQLQMTLTYRKVRAKIVAAATNVSTVKPASQEPPAAKVSFMDFVSRFNAGAASSLEQIPIPPLEECVPTVAIIEEKHTLSLLDLLRDAVPTQIQPRTAELSAYALHQMPSLAASDLSRAVDEDFDVESSSLTVLRFVHRLCFMLTGSLLPTLRTRCGMWQRLIFKLKSWKSYPNMHVISRKLISTIHQCRRWQELGRSLTLLADKLDLCAELIVAQDYALTVPSSMASLVKPVVANAPMDILVASRSRYSFSDIRLPNRLYAIILTAIRNFPRELSSEPYSWFMTWYVLDSLCMDDRRYAYLWSALFPECAVHSKAVRLVLRSLLKTFLQQHPRASLHALQLTIRRWVAVSPLTPAWDQPLNAVDDAAIRGLFLLRNIDARSLPSEATHEVLVTNTGIVADSSIPKSVTNMLQDEPKTEKKSHAAEWKLWRMQAPELMSRAANRLRWLHSEINRACEGINVVMNTRLSCAVWSGLYVGSATSHHA